MRGSGNISRRTFVLGSAVALAGASILRPAATAIRYPFTLGVASGDPSPDGFVLWTRLAPAPLNTDGLGGMPSETFTVTWQVATDEAMTTVVASGTVDAVPQSAHSVHVEPAGLQPATEYFYRFLLGEHVSTVGRTRTAPAAGTLPSPLR